MESLLNNPQERSTAGAATVQIAQEGEHDQAVEDLQRSTPQGHDGGGHGGYGDDGHGKPAAEKIADQAVTVEYPPNSAAFFATMTASTAEAAEEMAVKAP